VTRQPDTFPVRAAGVIGKGDSVAVVRHARRLWKRQRIADAYAIVDARDGRRCRLSGEALTAGHADMWKRLERHHLEPRSRSVMRQDDPENIVTLSLAAHRLIHSGALVLIDAQGEDTTHSSDIAGFRWAAHGRPPKRIVREGGAADGLR